MVIVTFPMSGRRMLRAARYVAFVPGHPCYGSTGELIALNVEGPAESASMRYDSQLFGEALKALGFDGHQALRTEFIKV